MVLNVVQTNPVVQLAQEVFSIMAASQKHSKLIEDACEAQEFFSLDELERFSNKLRQKGVIKHV